MGYSQNSETGEFTYVQTDSAKEQQLQYDAETGEPILDAGFKVRYLKQKNFHIPKKYLRGSLCEEFEMQMLGKNDQIYQEPTATISKEKFDMEYQQPRKEIAKRKDDTEKRIKSNLYNKDDYNIISNDILNYNKSNYRIFLLPTLFCFNIYAAVVVMILEIFFHMWAHFKNGLNMDKDYYYSSPLHCITSQFCAKCRSESEVDASIFRMLNTQMRKANKSKSLKEVSKAIG